MNEQYRIEKDKLGEMRIPLDSYFGIHTYRAKLNFQLSVFKTPIELFKNIALVKKAAASANSKLGFIESPKSEAILQACDEIIEGKFDAYLDLEALQGGAGTSTNMCVNELIANRALEILGERKGDYSIIHPIEHINLHQSTNDVYPSALKIAAIYSFRQLSDRCAKLQGVLQDKEKEFADILTISRTEMQDAVPIALGAQFGAFAEAIARDRWRAFKAEERLRSIPIGGGAVGTGLTSPKKYIFSVIEELRQISGLGLSRSENLMDGVSNLDSIIEAAAGLSALAANIRKIALDLRFMHYSGEIKLPEAQTGSSIMPGKVNPVICESTMICAMKINSSVALINDCSSQGTLQINEYMPLIAFELLGSLNIAKNAVDTLAKHISGIKANREFCAQRFNSSLSIITAFLPTLGYNRCESIIEEYKKMGTNLNFREYLETKLDKTLVESILSPQTLLALGYKL
jgi:aspartate ammonia-lyase